MRRIPGLLLHSILLAATAYAQTSPQPSVPQPNAHSTVLQTGVKEVVVDVVVQDKSGHPVRGLKLEDFRLIEDKTPQTLRTFAEHSTLAPPPPGPALPPLHPGTFTDYTPIAPNATLNILLLDALNTSMKDQSFVRYELQEYVKHADPGTRIAIFGLANRLILLQGFTSDPSTLRGVVEHKLISRSSPLLDDPTGTGQRLPQLSEVDTGQSAASLRQFEAETGAMETEFRAQLTLDAFNTLGHYLEAYPGRKNLIWLSGSFPVNILPDPSLLNPFAIEQSNDEELRETISLLSRAQVAVYPVDARGLMIPPSFDAANPSQIIAASPATLSADLNKFYDSQAAEHETMNALAVGTGGHAFYNTNNLAAAVAQATDAGANYYTLTYNPTHPKDDGAYHSIHVSLAAPADAPGLQLSYRRGYLADNASPADAGRAAAYEHAAMSLGAPAPEALLFKVRVLPASSALETAIAPYNQLDPGVPAKGPFRRYILDYIALPNEFTLTPQPDGSRSAKAEFFAYVFDADGRLLNATGKTISFTATPANYSRLTHSLLRCHLELSVPDQIQTFLRIAIRDVPSNKFGVLELPISTVSNLPPAVYPSAPTQANPSPPPATGRTTPPQR